MAFRSKRRRLFRKYVVIVVGLVTGAVVTSGAVEAYFAFRDNEASLVQLQREKASAAVGAIEQFTRELERDVGTALYPLEVPLDRRYRDFLRVLNQVPWLTKLVYIDPTGTVRIRHSLDAPDFPPGFAEGRGADRSSAPVFVQPKVDQPYFSRVFLVNGSEPHMKMALRAASGGVVVADITLKLIRDVISGIKVGKAGLAYAVDSEGDLIIHPDPTLLLQGTNLAYLPQVKAALGATGGGMSGEITVGRDPSGGKVLTATRSIPSLGWHVFVEQPLGEAFAPLYSSIFRTIILLIVGLALACLVSLVLARRMVTPIETLQVGAARIGGGDLDHTIQVRTGDELQALAEEFNRMTAQLRESYAGLEKKVEERTRDLNVALAQLEEKGRELETVSRHKSEFLANMSHELRTPLNAIIGFSEVLQEQMSGELNEAQMGYVGDVLEAGQHLLSLINDILDLSKIEAGRMELDLGNVSVPQALKSGLTMHGERAERNGITLTLAVGPEVGSIRADERKVRQVIFNLLSNAVKFTPPGGHVDVSACVADGMVEVAVADTGPGIAREDHEQIFEEFQQARGFSHGSREGTGLGLTLSRQFIELHGGRLWVESEQGAGSTFRFTLPLEQPR